MAISRNRLAPDPSICVMDLETAVASFCEDKGTYDLWSSISPTPGKIFSWKTAPGLEFLTKVSPLFIKLARVATNLVLPSKKLKAALFKIQRLTLNIASLFGLLLYVFDLGKVGILFL